MYCVTIEQCEADAQAGGAGGLQRLADQDGGQAAAAECRIDLGMGERTHAVPVVEVDQPHLPAVDRDGELVVTGGDGGLRAGAVGVFSGHEV